MLPDPDYTTARPATRTEQYQAQRLTERLWDHFDAPERALLRTAAQVVPAKDDSRPTV